jgi:hypothetical protein
VGSESLRQVNSEVLSTLVDFFLPKRKSERDVIAILVSVSHLGRN